MDLQKSMYTPNFLFSLQHTLDNYCIVLYLCFAMHINE
jgi:hypothetical protein